MVPETPASMAPAITITPSSAITPTPPPVQQAPAVATSSTAPYHSHHGKQGHDQNTQRQPSDHNKSIPHLSRDLIPQHPDHNKTRDINQPSADRNRPHLPRDSNTASSAQHPPVTEQGYPGKRQCFFFHFFIVNKLSCKPFPHVSESQHFCASEITNL